MTRTLTGIGRCRAVTVASLLALSFAFTALAEDVSLAPLTAQVETLRGRHFVKEVERKTLPRTELRSFLEKQLQKDLPMPVEDYVGVMRALHLIGKQDGIGPMLDLYEAQVLAFYDPVSHVFYSLDKPPEITGALPEAMQNAVIIHELTHALQDQLFNAGARMQGVQDDWDAQLAYQSVLEGEATLVMMGYLGESMGGMKLDDMVSSPDLLKTLTAASSANTGVPATTPRYFVESLKYPYIAGIGFVIDAYNRKGWEGVDQVDRCPPTTTAEINDPALYWKKIEQSAAGTPKNSGNASSLGAFHWDFLLGQGGSTGWVGDRVEVQHPSAKTPTVLVETRWDSPQHARDFQKRYEEFLKNQQEQPMSVVTGSTVRVAYGSDRAANLKFTRNKTESKASPRPRQCLAAPAATSR